MSVKGRIRKYTFAVLVVLFVGGIRFAIHRFFGGKPNLSDISYTPGPNDYKPDAQNLVEIKTLLSSTTAKERK